MRQSDEESTGGCMNWNNNKNRKYVKNKINSLHPWGTTPHIRELLLCIAHIIGILLWRWMEKCQKIIENCIKFSGWQGDTDEIHIHTIRTWTFRFSQVFFQTKRHNITNRCLYLILFLANLLIFILLYLYLETHLNLL